MELRAHRSSSRGNNGDWGSSCYRSSYNLSDRSLLVSSNHGGSGNLRGHRCSYSNLLVSRNNRGSWYIVISIVDSIGKVGIGNLGCHHRMRMSGIISSSNYWSLFRDSSCSYNRSFFSYSSINMVNRKVGGAYTESKGISNIVDSLDDSVTVNIAIAASDYSISSLDLLLTGVTITVSKAILTKVILAVVLESSFRGYSSCYSNRGSLGNNWGSVSNRKRSSWSSNCNWSRSSNSINSRISRGNSNWSNRCNCNRGRMYSISRCSSINRSTISSNTSSSIVAL